MFKLTFKSNKIGLNCEERNTTWSVSILNKIRCKKVLLVLPHWASLRLEKLCCINLESLADNLSVTCFQRWFTPVCINSLWCLCFPGGDHGSAGTKVSGSQQNCLLHHGGGGGREAPDRPSRGVQTNVSASHYILQHKNNTELFQISLLLLKHCIPFMSMQVFLHNAKVMDYLKIPIFPHLIKSYSAAQDADVSATYVQAILGPK